MGMASNASTQPSAIFSHLLGGSSCQGDGITYVFLSLGSGAINQWPFREAIDWRYKIWPEKCYNINGN